MSTAVLDLINAVKTFDDVYPGEEKGGEEEEGEEEGEEGEEEEDGVEETENMAANIVKVAIHFELAGNLKTLLMAHLVSFPDQTTDYYT